MIYELIAQMIAERNDCDPATITMDSRFSDLSIDSMDTMELIVQLEEKIGREIDLEEPVETVGDLVTLIEKKMEAEV